jgi:cystathionine beta-synthase
MSEAHPYKVEGIGEDMIPSTTHFQYVDEVVTVSDKESFLIARRVACEEGILGGGSCGSAMAGALKTLVSTGPDEIAVVLLPDTGERYLSKVYNDEWMRDNGFLELDAVLVGEVIGAKPSEVPALITIEGDRPVREAINLVREHDISVIPVMENGTVIGTAHEGELMHLVFDNPGTLDQSTKSVMGPIPPTLSPTDSVKAAIRLLSKDSRAVLVFDGDHPVGILTSIDVVGFISR